jgi:hypothetical protein
MTGVKQTWQEKRLAREECSGDSSADESPTNLGSTNGVESKDGDDATRPPDTGTMDINMVFVILVVLWALGEEVAKLAVEADIAMFKKPVKEGEHMRSLYIKGHLNDRRIGRMNMSCFFSLVLTSSGAYLYN